MVSPRVKEIMTEQQQIVWLENAVARLEHLLEKYHIRITEDELDWVYQMEICKKCEREYYDIEDIVFCDDVSCGLCPVCCKCASE